MKAPNTSYASLSKKEKDDKRKKLNKVYSSYIIVQSCLLLLNNVKFDMLPSGHST